MEDNTPLLTEIAIKWGKSVREAKMEEDETAVENQRKRMKLNTALANIM